MKTALVDGWKAEENKRFGQVLVLKFVDEKTDEIKWEWAPKLADEAFIKKMFDQLRLYDEALLCIKNLKQEVDEHGQAN